MAANFEIEFIGGDRVKKLLANLPNKIKKELRNEFIAVGKEWEGVARRDAPVFSSRTRGSISARVEDLTLSMGAQAKHAAYLEFGTGKQFKAPAILGNYPNQFKGSIGGGDPIRALTEWVKRKGLNRVTYNIRSRKKTHKNREAAARSIAFAIFRKRMREGSKPTPFLFTGKDGSDRIKFFIDRVKKGFANVLRRLV